MYLLSRALCAALLCSSVGAFALPAHAATSIDVAPSSSYVCGWGSFTEADPAVPTLGQTIVAPATDTSLDSFAFYLTQYRDAFTGLPKGDPVTLTYRAYVYAWDGQKATGPALWASDAHTHTTSPVPQLVTIDTGGVQLTGGGAYVIFLSVNEDYASNAPGDQACWMLSQGDYPGGIGAFLLHGTDQSDWTTEPWRTLHDVAFKASFSSPAGEPVYDFDGFFAPVDNKDVSGNYILNRARPGSAIPIKFSLNGDQGLDVIASGYPTSQVIACDSQAEVDGIEQTSAPGASGLSYDAGSDTYTYVWKTSRSWADTCRQLVVKFDDGTTARANFTFAP